MASSHGSLSKFKEGQKKWQSSLTSTSDKAGYSSAKTTSKASQPTEAKTPPPTVKFSNDIERLQLLNSKAKTPIGALIKRVVDLLRETRQALTLHQIKEACNVDMVANKIVFDSLRNNPRVDYNGSHFCYKSKHGLKDKVQVLKFIRKFPDGIEVNEVKDAYPTVMDDIQVMKAAGDIWLIYDKQGDIAYPNDPRVAIKVDEDLKQLFRETELPSDMLDIEQYLLKNKMKPATDTAKRRALAEVHVIGSEPKSKKKNIDFSKRKLTNTHLPELFKHP